MQRMGLLAFALILSSCASVHSTNYVGGDIREVILNKGNPVNEYDLEDGSRAFQFYLGGGTYQVLQDPSAYGDLTVVDDADTTSANSIAASGDVVVSKPCLITYVANLDEITKSWLITDMQYPTRDFCSLSGKRMWIFRR